MIKQIDLKTLLASKTEGMKPTPTAAQTIERAERAIPKNLMFSAESTEFIPETEPTIASTSVSKTVDEAQNFHHNMDIFIQTALTVGTDYGAVNRTSKPSLLKSGAEKIANFLGLIPRVTVISKTEDFAGDGFFAYTVKISLIDNSGTIRAEGLGSCNTKEPKYIKSTGFAMMNTVLKMAKKRALIDGVLNVACISNRFTQDMEDVIFEDNNNNTTPASAHTMPQTERPASQKQIGYIERLMNEIGTTAEKVNAYLVKTYGVDDYHKITSFMASELIPLLMAGKNK